MHVGRRRAIALCLMLSAWAGHARAQICDADFNDDGVVGSPDFALLGVCYRTPEPSTCAPADLDEDGDIDLCDVGAFECLFGTDSSNTSCCVDPVCAECACNPEIDGEPTVDLRDIGVLTACLGQPGTGDCQTADINCDRVVDRCDVDLLSAAIGELYVPDLCDLVICGACRTPDGCEHAGEASCTELGGELTPGARCGDPTAGAQFDFRGGGGIGCASSASATQGAPVTLVLAGLLVVLLVRARRR